MGGWMNGWMDDGLIGERMHGWVGGSMGMFTILNESSFIGLFVFFVCFYSDHTLENAPATQTNRCEDLASVQVQDPPEKDVACTVGTTGRFVMDVMIS